MSDQLQLLRAIIDAQACFVREQSASEAFSQLFRSVLVEGGPTFGLACMVTSDEDGQSLRRLTGSQLLGGMFESDLNELAAPVPLDCVVQEVLEAERSCVFDGDALVGRVLGLPGGHPDIHSLLILPMKVGGKVRGLLVLGNGAFGGQVSAYEPLSMCASIVAGQLASEERARELAEVSHRETLASAVVDGSLDSIVVIDERGIIQEVNPATTTMFGWAPEELVGQNVSILMPAHFARAHDGYVESYRRSGVARIIGTGREVFGRRRDGREFPLEGEGIEVLHEGRRFFVGSLRDIADRKTFERKLRELNRELELRVAEGRAIRNENSRINEMNSFLLTAESLEEIAAVVERFVPDLVPGVGAGFYLFQGVGEAEPVVSWGPLADDHSFRKSRCWAVRRGQRHQGGAMDMPCPHLEHHDPAWSLCIPVLGADGLNGVLTLVARDEVAEGYLTQAERVGQEVADRLGSAVSSMSLRSRLEDESTRDHLTRLHNRRYFDEQFTREMRRARRSGDPVSLVMLDVDHFKSFNDEHGHEAGDMVLQHLARIMERHVRSEDVVCRVGGEEFVLLLPGSSIEHAMKRADALRERVAGLELSLENGVSIQIQISAGVAAWPMHGDAEDVLLSAADQALYEAKRSGRNCVRRASMPPHQQSGNMA